MLVFEARNIMTLLCILLSSNFVFWNLIIQQNTFKVKKSRLMLSEKRKQIAGFADIPLCRTFYILHLYDPSKPLVVFLHGFTGSTQSYKPMMNRLSGGEINFLSFDFISHGKSQMLPSHLEMTNELLAKQLDQLLHYLFPGNNIPSLILVGHSQAGTFAPRYALDNISRVKSVMLIAPGGIDFKWKDYLDNPLCILVRNFYLIGCHKYTQYFVVRLSASLISLYRKLFWKPFSKALFYIIIPSVLGMSDSFRQIIQEYWHLIDDWLFNFHSSTNHPEKRDHYFRMIASMLDNLGLLRDNTLLFESLAKTGVPIQLVLARYDPIVTIQAGIRLFHKMNPNWESKMVNSFMYSSSNHLMASLNDSGYEAGGESLSDDSSLYLQSPNVSLHILKATHFVPAEAPGKLCQIVFDSYLNATMKI